MAKKRASLKDKGEEILGVKRSGRGADILFGIGTDAAPKDVPRDDSAVSAVAPPVAEGLPEGEADLDEGIDLEAALSVEAGIAEGEADLDELDLDELLSAEAEAAKAEAALPELATTPAAPAPPTPEPVVSPPSPSPAPPPAVERPAPAPPPVPTYPQRGPAGTPSMAVERPIPAPPAPAPVVTPPSTETGAPDLSVPRQPRYLSPVVGDDFDLLAEEISADGAAAVRVGAPEAVRLTAEQRARLLRRRSVQQKLAELEQAIEGQYDRILRANVSVSKPITDWCHNMLAEARSIVLNLQVEKLAKAEWNVEQVRARLDRADESRRQANWLAPPITVWGVIWFVAFVYLIFNPAVIISLLNVGASSDSFLVPEIFLRSLFFGGIGGVAAVFYHLFKYVRERSFDGQYALSYFGKPIMGMILGSMIYLTLFVLMKALNFLPSGLEGGKVEDVTDVMYAAILFFVAMAAGFKENLAFSLLNRVVKAVLGKEPEEEEIPSPPPTVAETS